MGEMRNSFSYPHNFIDPQFFPCTVHSVMRKTFARRKDVSRDCHAWSRDIFFENFLLWSILNFQHRKLFQRTEKYASKGFLAARPNSPQIRKFSSNHL